MSRRLDWDQAPNRLAQLEAERRAAGVEILDLTASNPTRVGLAYPPDLLAPLADPAALDYRPSPRGLPEARESVATYYRSRGVAVDAARILLTASSSESYAMLFKLLADPGDGVLVPQPSYPLFDYLARLEGIEPLPYQLSPHDDWRVDLGSVAAAAAHRCARALVVVSPNNPTGHVIQSDEWRGLSALCAELDLALIADEVFADYRVASPQHADGVEIAGAEGFPGTTFCLGGLSKSCGLPQLKLGWIVVGGAPAAAEAALDRLELIADTYLSVATPVQVALPRLLAAGAGIRSQIAARVARNRTALASAIDRASPVTLLPSQGGWSAMLSVPATHSDEEWALTLLREEAVLVQPGYFFDMPEGMEVLVVSLLPPVDIFDRAITRLVARIR